MADPMMPKPITPTVGAAWVLLLELLVREEAVFDVACLVFMGVLIVKNLGYGTKAFY
jgi:hypothetical protein